jgi:hypothetical protein
VSVPLAELIGNAHAFENLDDFRNGIPVLLREFVPADVASYNEMDEDPGGSWWTTDPVLTVSAELIEAFRELAGENPVLAYMRRTRDGRPWRISDFLTRAEYHRLPLYRDFYGKIEAEYQCAFTLPSRPPVVIGLALTRPHRFHRPRGRRARRRPSAPDPGLPQCRAGGGPRGDDHGARGGT